MIKKTSGWFRPFNLGWHDWPCLTKSSLRGSHTLEKISLKKSKTLIASRDIDDQRIQQSDWRRALLRITCEPKFPGHAIFTESYSTINTWIWKQFQPNLMAQLNEKVSKPHFWVIFHHFWSFLPKGYFFQKIFLSYTIPHEPWHYAEFQKS